MALQTTTNINVDFYDKKYTVINAKQLDKSSRFLSVTCYNHGELCSINSGEHAAYIRYKKPDGYSVFNFCEIDRYGKIIVELTEQMLAVDGLCYADLVIVNQGSASVDVDTGEITVTDSGILSTMPFRIDVSETAVANSEIEASSEFIQFNETLEEYWADYENVVLTARSWAIGETGIRDGEDADNAKYYAKQADNSANSSTLSATSASTSASNAQDSMQNALRSEQNAQTYMNNAKAHMDNASASEINAKTSENNAKTSENNAAASEENAKASEESAYDYSVMAQRYAIGGTNTTIDEDIDNAKYYYEQVRNIAIGASVIGVKGENESEYRRGNVNLTADNIGAIPTTDKATVDEIKNYLDI